MTVAGLCLASVSGIRNKGIKEKSLSLSTTRGSISNSTNVSSGHKEKVGRRPSGGLCKGLPEDQ